MSMGRRAAIEFAVTWTSEVASHRDRSFSGRINFWRDIFPPRMEEAIAALGPGETAAADFAPGEIAPVRDPALVRRVRRAAFEEHARPQVGEAKIGRFYPRGLVWQELGCFRGDIRPMRVAAMDAEALTVDLNHPLAGRALRLEARLIEELPPAGEVGGSCIDIGEFATQKGPGMVAPLPGLATDFGLDRPLSRLDANPDPVFYGAPRLVKHLDEVALGEVTALYRRLLKPGTKVLDLMSSWVSHLPDDRDGLEVTGLGLNQAELDANPRLTTRLVHDLNADPALPFPDRTFDAVICTSSVEYLVAPVAVLRELARVARPGGVVAMTFSDRWFPMKVVDIWPDLHPFERQGLALAAFLAAGGYADLNTETIRGLPRPIDDPHIRETQMSDPVFAVWGKVAG